jgi:opacity protein-like surface antigen
MASKSLIAAAAAKTCLAALLFALAAGSAHAAENESYKPGKNEIGFHGGFTTGTGLSYRRWFADIGAQLTALPIFTPRRDYLSGAFTLMYSVKSEEDFRFFLFLGTHLYRTRNLVSDCSYYDELSSGCIGSDFAEYDKFKTTLNTGIGPGISAGKAVRFNLMAGYGFYNLTRRVLTFPSLEAGLYYCF